MREEVLSSVGAQDTDTREYEITNLEDIEFSSENLAVEMDRICQPGIDSPFSHLFLTIFIWDQLLPTQ